MFYYNLIDTVINKILSLNLFYKLHSAPLKGKCKGFCGFFFGGGGHQEDLLA